MKLWKRLVGLFFLLVIFDGALRKWVFPEQATALFLLKDVVLWGGFIAYASTRPVQLPRPLKGSWLSILLGAYIFVVLLQSTNLRLPSLAVSALGLKAHLAYLPLLVLMPALLAETTERKIIRTLWGYALLIYLPIAALGVYQFFQPPGHWINQYVREMQAIATVGDHVRITGTFAYIGSFTGFLNFNAFLGAGVLLTGVHYQDRKLRQLGVLLVAVTAIILPMAGSRGPVLIVGVGLAILILVIAVQRRQMFRLALSGALVAVLLVLISDVTHLDQGWAALAKRAEHATDEQARIVSLMNGPIQGFERAGLIGFGVGASHQAAPQLVSGSFGHDWLPEGFVENGIVQVITELGLIGYLVLMALKGMLLYIAYKTLRRSATPIELIISSTAFCMTLAYLVFPVVFSAVANAFYWGSTGAVIGVWSLQEKRRLINNQMRAEQALAQ